METKQFSRAPQNQPSQNLSERRVKEISRDCGSGMDRLANGGITFALIRKSLRNGKKTSACLKIVLRNYALS